MNRGLARALLRVAFTEAEAEEILRDIAELTAGRRGVSRVLAFWMLVLSYPLEEARERARACSSEGGRGG